MTKSGAFKSLSDSEYNLLINSVPLVAVLIAGADGQIDPKEKEWANKIVKIRSFANTIDLKPLYQDLEEKFLQSWKKLFKGYHLMQIAGIY